MNEDFADFQKYFKEYQRHFGLMGYEIYFKYESIGDNFADMALSQDQMVATVRLNSKLLSKDKPHKDIKRDAKHEALHLLIGRLEKNGRYRYVSDAEMYEATEELVNRLADLIDS